jgi:hypothetical protein
MREFETLSAVIVATTVPEGINDKPLVSWYCSLSRLFYNVPFTGVVWLEDMAQLLRIVNWDVAKPADSCIETGYGFVTFCM